MATRTPPQLYLDDPDEGPSPSTSHPDFVKRFPEEFFYDCTDEFAPFGSDAGADALASLQDALQEKEPKPVRDFVEELLESWGVGLPDLTETREDHIIEWLADEVLAISLPEVNQGLIAVALGQYKISGAVDPEVLELALAAAAREIIATRVATEENPDWKHAAQKAAADARLRAALESLGAPTPAKGSKPTWQKTH